MRWDKPTYRFRCQNKRAWHPCPICGRGPSPPLPPNPKLSDIFKNVYGNPYQVIALEVPGWKGFYQWWIQCSHNSIQDLVPDMSYYSMVKDVEAKYIESLRLEWT